MIDCLCHVLIDSRLILFLKLVVILECVNSLYLLQVVLPFAIQCLLFQPYHSEVIIQHESLGLSRHVFVFYLLLAIVVLGCYLSHFVHVN